MAITKPTSRIIDLQTPRPSSAIARRARFQDYQWVRPKPGQTASDWYRKCEAALSFLENLPDDRLEDVLDVVEPGHDPIAELNSLQHGIIRSNGLSNYATTRATYPPTNWLAYDLSLTHPAAYPILLPVDEKLIPVESLSKPHPANATSLVSSAASSSGNERKSPQRPLRPLPPATLIDSRLYTLKISQWTGVPISNELAARMLTLWFETDHMCVGFFDAELFITTLCAGVSNDFCSPFLVSCMLFLASVRIVERPSPDSRD